MQGDNLFASGKWLHNDDLMRVDQRSDLVPDRRQRGTLNLDQPTKPINGVDSKVTNDDLMSTRVRDIMFFKLLMPHCCHSRTSLSNRSMQNPTSQRPAGPEESAFKTA